MQKKLMFLTVAITLFIPVYADVRGKFDDFLMEVVAIEDQKQFRSFYMDLVSEKEQIARGKKHHKEDKTANLRRLGWNALQVRNPELASQLRPELKNPQKAKQIQDFLFRFGTYEMFLKERATKENNLLAKTRAYFRDTKNKVVSWVESKIKRNKAAA
jgi:hypothetical protein